MKYEELVRKLGRFPTDIEYETTDEFKKKSKETKVFSKMGNEVLWKMRKEV